MPINHSDPTHVCQRGNVCEVELPKMRGSKYPTCNYDACENAPYRAYKDSLVEDGGADAVKWFTWGLTFVIGVGTALVAYGIDVVTHQLITHKNRWVIERIGDCNGCMDQPYGILLATNTAYVTIAAVLVFAVPAAAGSGIPEVKCYLNGLRLPGILSLQTLVAKSCGVLMSVSGGLPCGKEGPMIHSGAIVASGLSQGIPPLCLKTFNFNKGLQKFFLPFRDDKSKRDFISCGAAAGVAAAFGAPVGGVLFALEEGCSFWDPVLTWRLFFCSITCAFSMAFFTNTGTGERSLNAPGMIDFGDFSKGEQVPFDSVELVWFVIIGAGGGLLGALFNHLNLVITRLRGRRDDYLTGQLGLSPSIVKVLKILEAMVMAFLVSSTAFFCIAGIPAVCNSTPAEDTTNIPDVDISEILVHIKCNETSEYNSFATLWLNSASETLKLLFHFPGDYDDVSLLVSGVLYFMLMVVNYGVAVPSGLFVPSLVTGAFFGRVAGELVKKIPYHTFQKVDPGTYALIGAASFLAGVCRITFSLTVILLEATRDIAYALPLMFCIMTAKLVGDAFNTGIYDMHIAHRKLAFLEPSIDPALVRRTTVSQFMTKRDKLITLNPVESVARILYALKTRTFCGFPVCRDDHSNIGSQHDGLVTRSRLLVLLYKKEFKTHRNVVITRDSLAGKSIGEAMLAEFMDRNRLDKVSGVVHGAESMSGNQVKVVLEGIEEPLVLPFWIVQDSPHGIDFLSWDEFDFPKVDYALLQGHEGLERIEANMTNEDFNKLIDLRPYMNPMPFLVPDNFSYERSYRLFRSVGLRHMLVINGQHHLTGIVTRHDFWKMHQMLANPPEGWKNDRGMLVKEEETSQTAAESDSAESSCDDADEGGSHWEGELGEIPMQEFSPF